MNTAIKTTRNTIAAVAVITLGFSSNAFAATQTVTRGPNGAASIVKKVPVDAQLQPQTEPHAALKVVNRGPNFAAHITTKETAPTTAAITPSSNVITRGPNGAAYLAN